MDIYARFALTVGFNFQRFYGRFLSVYLIKVD